MGPLLRQPTSRRTRILRNGPAATAERPQVSPNSTNEEAEAERAQESRRAKWTFRIAIATIAVTTLAVVPAFTAMWIQLNQMSEQLEVAKRQVADSKRAERTAAPRITPSFLEAGWGNFGDPPMKLAQAVTPNSRVLSADFESVDPFLEYDPTGEFTTNDEFIRKGCKCGELAGTVKKTHYGDNLFWSYLVLSQSGGSTAQDVKVTLTEIQPGELTYTYFEDSLESIRSLPGSEITLSVGAIKPGETVIVPIWLGIDSYSRSAPNDQFWTTAISKAFVPSTFSYVDSATNQTEKISIRALNATPVILKSGVVGRG